MTWFRKTDKAAKEAERNAKVEESQNILLSAAIGASNAAKDVTRLMQRKMEDAIKQFIQTARIMNDALLICDPGGSITAFNPAAQRMFGLPDQPTEPAMTLFQRGDEAVGADELWKLGRSKKRTLSGVHADGTKFPAHIRVSILDRSDGSTVILMVVQDLTMIHKNFGESQNGYAVISQNEIVAANQSISRIFGYEHDDLLGRCPDAIMGSKDRAGNHLNLMFEVARIQWEGEEGVFITVREPFPETCPTCGRKGYHTHPKA